MHKDYEKKNIAFDPTVGLGASFAGECVGWSTAVKRSLSASAGYSCGRMEAAVDSPSCSVASDPPVVLGPFYASTSTFFSGLVARKFRP